MIDIARRQLGAAASGDLFVVEADESDGSFLLYDTAVALITNVDPDHLDHYGSLEAFDDAFVDLRPGAGELVVVSSDDPGARRASPRACAAHRQRIITLRRGRGRRRAACTRHRHRRPRRASPSAGRAQRLPRPARIPGRHNAINAAGAFAVLVGLGFDPAALARRASPTSAAPSAASSCTARSRGVSVYDDYAHHPTEVAAALAAARTVVGDGRIIAVHQPHLYSRTRLFAREFAEVLERYADETVVLDVYGAREDPEPGVTGALVADRFADPDARRIPRRLAGGRRPHRAIAREGDFVITLGCGDVYRIVPQLLDALRSGLTTA